MSEKNERIAIAGASSLLGRELAEDLQESQLAAATVSLLDEEETEGKLETIADEVTFIQKIDAEAFKGSDFVFFAGDAAMTKEHWNSARSSGASIVDLTYVLEGEQGVLVRAPGILDGGTTGPDLKTPAVVSAHPVAIMLAQTAARLQASLKVRSLAATVLQPASEHGRAAMDELHQQTVNLLSFQTLPKEQYDAQVAFNLLPLLGAEARVQMSASAQRVREHYAIIGNGHLPEVALQMVQAPVFHGFAISLLIDLENAVPQDKVERALGSDQIDVVLDDADPPSNLSAAGQADILARITAEPPDSAQSNRFWVWMTADNLKIAAANAIACAMELKKLRPSGAVQ